MTGEPNQDDGKPEMGNQYTIVARYSTGPPVSITVHSACDPAIDNSSLQAADAATVITVLDGILDQSDETATSTR